MAQWGEKNWFKALYHEQGTSKPSAYFAHRKNGYQKYRHDKLIRFFEESRPDDWTGGGSFLDIGCATGDFANTFLERTDFTDGYGVDFLDEAVATASKHYPALSFQVSVLPHIPIADNSRDLIIASEVLYYLSEPDRRATVLSARRALRADGLFLFTAALGPNYFSPDQARALLEPDFEILAEGYDHVRLYHRFIAPFDRLHRLHEIMQNPELYGQGRLYQLVTQHPLIFRNPVSLAIMGIITMLTSALFSWKWIPASIAGLSRILMEKKARSNILILARAKTGANSETTTARAEQA